MKKLKLNQVGPFCSFCPPKSTRAVYRECFNAGKFCCENHKTDLEKWESKHHAEDHSDAAYQLQRFMR